MLYVIECFTFFAKVFRDKCRLIVIRFTEKQKRNGQAQMITLTSMIVIIIIYKWQGGGVPYAMCIAVVVEIYGLIYLDKLIKKTQNDIKKDYDKKLNELKKRIKVYDQVNKASEEQVQELKRSNRDYELDIRQYDKEVVEYLKKISDRDKKIEALKKQKMGTLI